jgi:hypothetical protein
MSSRDVLVGRVGRLLKPLLLGKGSDSKSKCCKGVNTATNCSAVDCSVVDYYRFI